MGVGRVTVPSTANLAATAFMGVGGVTVPSPAATSWETALMAFMQQNAVDREADRQTSAADREANRQANEARDAIMTGLLPRCNPSLLP